jgi:hypothetical protein
MPSSPRLKMERDHVSETLFSNYLEFRRMDNSRKTKRFWVLYTIVIILQIMLVIALLSVEVKQIGSVHRVGYIANYDTLTCASRKRIGCRGSRSGRVLKRSLISALQTSRRLSLNPVKCGQRRIWSWIQAEKCITPDIAFILYLY